MSRPLARREVILRNKLAKTEEAFLHYAKEAGDAKQANADLLIRIADVQLANDGMRFDIKSAQQECESLKADASRWATLAEERGIERDSRLTRSEVRELLRLSVNVQKDDPFVKALDEAKNFRDFEIVFRTIQALDARSAGQRIAVGFKPMEPVAMPAAPALCEVRLTKVGANVIGAIKAVRNMKGWMLGLKEATDLVDAVRFGSYRVVGLGSKEWAEGISKQLRDVGCWVEVRAEPASNRKDV